MDPVSGALTAAASRSTWAIPLAALAGLVTSVGPCVAPRYVAVAALISNGARMRGVLSFIAGVIVGFVALAAGAQLLAFASANVHAINGGMAAILIITGIVVLWRDAPNACDHLGRHVPPGGAFVLGATSTLVVSPCCAPFALAIASLATVNHTPMWSLAVLSAFAFGHATPMLVGGTVGESILRRLAVHAGTDAPRVVAGALTLGIGAYDALLA